MTTDGAAAPDRVLRTARMEAFSDGVFAIAITLLVLELSVPEGSEENLLPAMLEQWPSYLAYVVSFATVGAIWLAHLAVTEHLDHADVWWLRINLLLLLVVSFLPFPTRLLAQSIGHEDAAKVATVTYGITLLVAASVLSTLWRYAVTQRLVRSETGAAELALLTRRLTPGLGGYLAMIVLGLFFPVVAVLGYLLVAIFYLLPIRAVHRRTRTAKLAS